MSIRKPIVLVLEGPNGSGKSTIMQYFDKVGEYTNADDVVVATGMNNFEESERRRIFYTVYICINSQYIYQRGTCRGKSCTRWI